jgi:glycosyltransferase involved in cell wall biosynthesis
MKKIAMYSTSQLFGKRVTGGLKRFLELYYGLVNLGNSVDLYSSDTPKVLKDNNVDGYSLSTGKISQSIFIPAELKILLKNLNIIKQIKREKYDQVIVFDVPTAIGICLTGIKHVQLLIRQDLIEYKKISMGERIKNKLIINFYLWFMKFCESICLIRSEKIIVQCKYDYNALVKRHKVLKKTIEGKTIIQINNVNPSWIMSKSNAANKEKDIIVDVSVKSKFRLAFIGDFSNERKGQRIFVDAVKGMLDKRAEIEAVIIGDGKQLETYKNECSKYETIRFTGRLDNPISVIKNCDLLVVPSLADSCPNTVMEALYNEIPVIGAKSGGIPEILVDENSLFEPTSASLQKCLIYLLENENLSILRECQKKRKKELMFDWVLFVSNHLDI